MRMFQAYLERSSDRLSYKQVLRVLCAFGVGRKEKQAEALFFICDENGKDDKERTVSRGELLKFISQSLPDDTTQHKTETFSKVGHVFMMMDEDGSGEISLPEWIDAIANNSAIYDAFTAMNPYKHFFKYWNDKDFSLQNLLTAAYYSDDPAEQRNAIKDRVSLLGKAVDEDGSGMLEFDETYKLMEVGFETFETLETLGCGAWVVALASYPTPMLYSN